MLAFIVADAIPIEYNEPAEISRVILSRISAKKMIGIQNMFAPTEEAQTTNGLLAAAFEGMPIAVLVTDMQGIIQLANPQVCVTLGMRSEDLVGKHINTLLGIWDALNAQAVGLPLAQVTQLGLSLAAREMVLTSNETGESKRYSVSLGPVTGEGRAVVGVMLTFDTIVKAEQQTKSPARAVSSDSSPSKQLALYVRTGGRYVRVLLSELLWVEAMENYVHLKTIDDKFVVHATLKSMVDALAGKGFQRIHRSFIVKKDEIERIEENHVTVHGTPLPIGKSFRAELLDGLTLI
jgi:PAS domain S-box-containing protein